MQVGIHISHEAEKKIGGIGSVLSGLCNTHSYQKEFPRTIFYGPLFEESTTIHPDRLGHDAEVHFSSLDGIEDNYLELHEICQKFHIDIVYGTRRIFDEIHPSHSTDVEIILVGIKRLKIDLIDLFKFQLWEKYRFQSDLYSEWDCEQYIRLAVPFLDIVKAMLDENDEIVAFSHEYMGVPSCLNLLLGQTQKRQTLFYAHEVSTVRALIERLPGHDIGFYNIMSRDMQDDRSLEERYGSQKNNYRNEMIKLATHFDRILAVGDWVKKEYTYLQPKVHEERISIVYNGVPNNKITLEDKKISRQRLITYCNTLFNFRPDIIFTHVTRLVISKGLWRDIRFLEEMDRYFSDNDLKGFYLLLSSLITTGRAPEKINQMEKEYGWPVLHREGDPDLIDYEIDVYRSLEIFNAKSKSIKGIFINQYGFSPAMTGSRIPEGTTFSDLRYGSDAELGFSVYEPFGIAQIETVPFGGLAILSRQCGCSFLLDTCFDDISEKPYFAIDFTEIDPHNNTRSMSAEELLALSATERTKIEGRLFQKYGKDIFNILPRNEQDRLKLFEQAQQRSDRLGWENNTSNHFRHFRK